MPTTGLFSGVEPIDPWKPASPKANTPPSEEASRYPVPRATTENPAARLPMSSPGLVTTTTRFPSVAFQATSTATCNWVDDTQVTDRVVTPGPKETSRSPG